MQRRAQALRNVLSEQFPRLPTLENLSRASPSFDQGLLAASRSLRLSNTFVLAMVSLAAINAAYTGWHITWPPSPEWWAVVVFIVAAIVYISVVSAEISRVSSSLADSIERLPTTLLHAVKHKVPSDLVVSLFAQTWGEGSTARSRLLESWANVLADLRTADELQRLWPSHSVWGQYYLFMAKWDGEKLHHVPDYQNRTDTLHRVPDYQNMTDTLSKVNEHLARLDAQQKQVNEHLARLDAQQKQDVAQLLTHARKHLEQSAHSGEDVEVMVAMASLIEEETSLAGVLDPPQSVAAQLMNAAVARLEDNERIASLGDAYQGRSNRDIYAHLEFRQWLWPRNRMWHDRFAATFGHPEIATVTPAPLVFGSTGSQDPHQA
jgi:hypothetical protein